MKLPSVQWKIACRNRQNLDTTFFMIKNPWWGWAADPFVFDYKGKTYLFAELWDYRTAKGCLGYKILEDKNSDWKVVISENYHLSYPHIFKINEQIYMCPESNASNSVYFYKAINFPDRWEKQKPFLKGKYCDTTFLKYREKLYGFTCIYHTKPYKLLLFELDKNKVCFSDNSPILEGGSMTRPGGGFFEENGKLIRVSQDCHNYYGEALFFTEVNLNWPSYKEKLIKKITITDIKLNKAVHPIGIHTYNRSNFYEVIDLKFYKINLINVLYRIKMHLFNILNTIIQKKKNNKDT